MKRLSPTQSTCLLTKLAVDSNYPLVLKWNSSFVYYIIIFQPELKLNIMMQRIENLSWQIYEISSHVTHPSDHWLYKTAIPCNNNMMHNMIRITVCCPVRNIHPASICSELHSIKRQCTETTYNPLLWLSALPGLPLLNDIMIEITLRVWHVCVVKPACGVRECYVHAGVSQLTKGKPPVACSQAVLCVKCFD